MSDHAAQELHGHGTAGHAPTIDLRFEKSELDFFVDEDRGTGKNIGKMLALIFCVLVVLMGGVAWWTNHNEFASQDPFDVPRVTNSTGGH